MNFARFILAAAFAFVGLTSLIYPRLAFAQVASPFCRPGYTVGFFNGVFNTRDDAREALGRLRAIGGNVWKGQPVSYQLLYNHSGMSPDRPGVTRLEDLAEVILQKNVDLHIVLIGRLELFWQALRGDGQDWRVLRATGWGATAVQAYVSVILNRALSAFAWFLSNPPTAADTAAHEAKLLQEIASGRKLLLVGHSQGNLFLNSAFRAVYPKTSIQAMKAVQVAPASALAYGPYTTATIDAVIGGLVNMGLLGGVLPPNWTLPASHLTLDWSGHRFLETYLNRSLTSSGKIEDEVRTAMNSLEDPPLDSTRYQRYLAAVSFLAPQGSLPEPPGLVLDTDAHNWTYIDGMWNMTLAERGVLLAEHAQGYYWTSAIEGQGANGFWLESLGTGRWCGQRTLRAWGSLLDEQAYRTFNPGIQDPSFAAILNADPARHKLGSPEGAIATLRGYLGVTDQQIVQAVTLYTAQGRYTRFVAQPESAPHEGIGYVPLSPDHYRGKALVSIVVDRKL